MVAARHFYHRFVQTRADHQLPNQHGIDHGHRMLGNKIEPPEAHALALEYIRNVTLDPSCVVCGTSRPEEVERQVQDQN